MDRRTRNLAGTFSHRDHEVRSLRLHGEPETSPFHDRLFDILPRPAIGARIREGLSGIGMDDDEDSLRSQDIGRQQRLALVPGACEWNQQNSDRKQNGGSRHSFLLVESRPHYMPEESERGKAPTCSTRGRDSTVEWRAPVLMDNV